ncbi:phosphoribosyltransferase-like protein [Podospora appendiculata]|uniref:Phosphoribosyltransferase-like protein n=1 Tax=Podospora appendiculata TaxID=314037 RepID=A0AAE0X5X1_9PEZI|nr:phosphoribosyltransferase-like protein [Podospora appendiculata]
MVRNMVILGGNSHPKFVESICNFLGVAPAHRLLSKFSSGESRCEIQDSVRGKDVYIIQSFGADTDPSADRVNDYFMEVCIMISACKGGSARRVTVVLPLFPYSRQPDLPFSKAGAPLSKAPVDAKTDYTFESVPATPGPNIPRTAGLNNGVDLTDMMGSASLSNGGTRTPPVAMGPAPTTSGSQMGHYTTHDYDNPTLVTAIQSQSTYKYWMAQSGALVADLLICSGADRVITSDLHESTYQGFFDVPVDNLYTRPMLQRYIQRNIENYKDAVIVSPDAGGAKRATAIADNLDLNFALIHKERRTTNFSERQKATMMLVGDVSNRVCILIDDLADTANTITRAAKLLKKEGAVKVYAILTHGVLSGDAIARINASALDKVVVTNTVPQDQHLALCPKLEQIDVTQLFAEAIRRVHHGESISVLFQNDL